MQREKSASLSEADYAELQKSRAAAEAKAKKEKEANESSSVPAAGAETCCTTSNNNTTAATENATTTPTVTTSRQRSAPTRRSVNDFRFGKSIGEGSFSTVYLCKDIHTGKECASEY